MLLFCCDKLDLLGLIKLPTCHFSQPFPIQLSPGVQYGPFVERTCSFIATPRDLTSSCERFSYVSFCSNFSSVVSDILKIFCKISLVVKLCAGFWQCKVSAVLFCPCSFKKVLLFTGLQKYIIPTALYCTDLHTFKFEHEL